MSMSGKEPLKDLETLIKRGNIDIEKTSKNSFKNYYIEMVHRLSKKPIRVMVPSQIEEQDQLRGRITEIPKISEDYIDEVEISPIIDIYSYVRIKFDNIASEYIYEVIERYAPQGKFAYIHFRNVRGKVPNYQETFVDDGDIDMLRALQLLKDCGYDGVLVPDHTPQMTCAAPWHCGIAYALGFMRAALRAIDAEEA